MTTISLFKFDEIISKSQVVKLLDGRRENGFTFRAKESRFREDEVEIDVWFEENIENGLSRLFPDDASEIVQYLKENGKEKIIRKIYCFLDARKRTLEIYRGYDAITEAVKQKLEKILSAKFYNYSLTSEQLAKIVKNYSSELKQAMFKYIHGLWYSIIRGRHLENNEKYSSYLQAKPDSLRMISVIPKIKYMSREYMVTINGDKGTIKMADGYFKWKPRFEIKQIVDIITTFA
ncbi:MAG: hypothetical protein QXM68_02770 [Candidatus Aenigmatarchaeota archaeon]|nr:hypothetical protein [Candidatus Aenigmarchaeota archaeon]